MFRVKRLLIIRGEEIKVVERTRSTACATPKLHSGCERHYRLIPIRRAIREERQRVRPALANLRGSVSCTQKTTKQARAIEAAHLATYPFISMSGTRDVWQVSLSNWPCKIDSQVVDSHF
jgi:hypothetical protein